MPSTFLAREARLHIRYNGWIVYGKNYVGGPIAVQEQSHELQLLPHVYRPTNYISIELHFDWTEQDNFKDSGALKLSILYFQIGE